jgi:hypothetical protein
VYAIPLDHFSGFDPDAGDDVLYADDGLYGLALSQTGGHLSAYSAVYSSSGDGHDVVHLTAPATPTLTAVVDADDPTSLSITVPGSWSQDHYTLHVTAGGHDVAATATDCDEDWEAKTSTCTVGSLERGVTYGISVSASNVFGSATSDVTTIRTPGVLAGPSTVSFTGTAQVGATLTAAVGTGWPAGTTFTYAWGWGTGRMGGLAATTPTFKVPASLAGTYLTLIVTGRQGTDYREVRSAAVLVKAAAPQVLPALPTTAKATPKVAGKAKVGKKLRASVGTWPAGTTLHYQWYANGKVVKGATRTTLKVTRKLKGKKVSVRVTGTKPGYAAVTRASKPVRVS